MYYKDLREALIEWMVDMSEKGASISEIADVLQRIPKSTPSIRKYLKEKGIMPRRKGRPNKKPEQLGLRLTGDEDDGAPSEV